MYFLEALYISEFAYDFVISIKNQANLVIFGNIFTDEIIGDIDSAIYEVLQYYRIKRYEEIPEIIAID